MALIEINNVTFSYPTAQTAALNDFSLQIEKGQFVVLFGSSGSGKSTLLRLLKKDIQPFGQLSGEILIGGQSIRNAESSKVGFVFQDPENQVVADDVLHEMVFGLENIGLSTNVMRNRVAEMVHFFGVESILGRKTHELSGGMKQQLNLASVLLMQPEILLLDEPTAQLDPVSAREFLDMLIRLNEEFGMTIILAEHRLDDVFTIADKIVMMENGKVKVAGDPHKVLNSIWESSNRDFVPTIPSLYFSLTDNEKRAIVPLSVKDGRNWVQKLEFKPTNELIKQKPLTATYNKMVEVKDLYFSYRTVDDFSIKDLQFTLNKGEIYALLGGNGSGKSTFLKILMGILKPNKGKILLLDKPLKAWKGKELAKFVGYLPQNPKLFFIQDTVEKEIQATKEKWGITNEDEVHLLLERFGITHLLNKHPYDLSGGEIQKAALLCVLLRKPEILLLDEPTKGLDPASKKNFSNIIQELQKKGITIVMSTHDVEFAALHATKCGMMFQGNITSEDVPSEFFKGNFFYTTMIQRLFRNSTGSEAITLKEAISICGRQRE